MPLVARRTSDQSNGSEPSVELLPSDGLSAPARPPAPARALAAEALRLHRRFARGTPLPEPWTRAGFGREVALVRTHLALVRSRAVLAASYGREAFHIVVDRDDIPGAVRVAYAIRWLELGDGRRRPAWPADPRPQPAALNVPEAPVALPA